MKRHSILYSCLAASLMLASTYATAADTLATSPAAAKAAAKVGPAAFFNMPEILDESTLDTKIISDKIMPSSARPGKQVRVIELQFTSQNWKDMVWRHKARIYVPDGYQGGGNAGIIGTERDFFDDPTWYRLKIVGTSQNTEAEYAEGTAIDLGTPIMMFSNPPEDFMGMDESDLMGYSLKKAAETGDLSWFGYVPITRAYLRAITLMHSLPGVRTEHAVITGCSKRGMAVSMATGVGDNRLAGVMPTCYYGGNNLYALSKRFSEFGADVRGPEKDRSGPGFQPAENVLRSFNNPLGFALLTHFDPYMWRSRINVPFVVTLGTNDQFYALGSANSIIKEMSGDRAFIAIDNTNHTWVSPKHLAAWRLMLAHTFFKRPFATVQAKGTLEADQLQVQAKVDTATDLKAVRLFYAYNPVTMDWRQSKWESTPMTKSDSGYAAQVPRRDGQSIGYYVEVEDTGIGGTGYVSSLMERVN